MNSPVVCDSLLKVLPIFAGIFVVKVCFRFHVYKRTEESQERRRGGGRKGGGEREGRGRLWERRELERD